MKKIFEQLLALYIMLSFMFIIFGIWNIWPLISGAIIGIIYLIKTNLQ